MGVNRTKINMIELPKPQKKVAIIRKVYDIKLPAFHVLLAIEFTFLSKGVTILETNITGVREYTKNTI